MLQILEIVFSSFLLLSRVPETRRAGGRWEADDHRTDTIVKRQEEEEEECLERKLIFPIFSSEFLSFSLRFGREKVFPFEQLYRTIELNYEAD